MRVRSRGLRSRRSPQPAPPQGTGHYSCDGRRWWDDNRQQWLHVVGGSDTLEIDAEEIGQRSVLQSLFSTLTGSYGTALFWFVGQATSKDVRWPTYRILGDSFPVMRAQPFDELPAGGPFAEEANHALTELRDRLTAEGWRPVGRGRHWYSYQYERPCLDWSEGADSEPGKDDGRLTSDH